MQGKYEVKFTLTWEATHELHCLPEYFQTNLNFS